MARAEDEAVDPPPSSALHPLFHVADAVRAGGAGGCVFVGVIFAIVNDELLDDVDGVIKGAPLVAGIDDPLEFLDDDDKNPNPFPTPPNNPALTPTVLSSTLFCGESASRGISSNSTGENPTASLFSCPMAGCGSKTVYSDPGVCE
jgi:hypothetical protein